MATGNDIGLYIPTTNVWDTSQIQQLQEESPQLKELLVRLYQNLNRMAIAVNLKDSALYDLNEFINGQQWFANPASVDQALFGAGRSVYRTVLNFGTLPNATTKSVAHNITCTTATSFTRIYGAATNPVSTFSYIPLPYASTTDVAHNIELYVDGTNMHVKTGANYSAYTISYIVLEYIQQ